MQKNVNILFSSADVTPGDFNKPIIYITGNGKVGTFKNTADFLGGDETKKFSGFERLREKYNIKFWCYQKALTEQISDC